MRQDIFCNDVSELRRLLNKSQRNQHKAAKHSFAEHQNKPKIAAEKNQNNHGESVSS